MKSNLETRAGATLTADQNALKAPVIKSMSVRSKAWFDNPGHVDIAALDLERTMKSGLRFEALQSDCPTSSVAHTNPEIAPCHRHHIMLSEHVRQGTRDAGGRAFEFPIHPIQETCKRPIASLDRDLHYLSLGEMLYSHPIDGMVPTTGCGKLKSLITGVMLALGVVTQLALSGCGGDSSGMSEAATTATENKTTTEGKTATEDKTTLSVLPPTAPQFMHFTYPAAMCAPLPVQGTFGLPPNLPASQTYFNTAGTLGVLQTQGAVATQSNAFFQSLGSNGRSCFSCHNPSNGMGIGTNTLQSLYQATNGHDPVFAPVDGANCPKSVPQTETRSALFGGAMGQGMQSSRDAHSLLLNKGLFRIFLPVPAQAEFTVAVVSDPYGCNTDPAYAKQIDATTQLVHQMISVYRRPRMSANLLYVTTPALTLGGGGLPNIDFVTGAAVVDPTTGNPIGGNIMWDGREPTLESQAMDATLGHAQATKPPTAAQIAQIVAYEKSVFSAQSSDRLGGALLTSSTSGGPAKLATSVPSFGTFALYDAWPTTSGAPTAIGANARASIARGQALFNARSLTVGNVAGFNDAKLLGIPNPTKTTCASCHGNLQAGNDPFSAGQRDIGVGGQAVAFGGPGPSWDLPIFKLTCKASATTSFNGSVVTTNDPGLALITGKCADIGRRSAPQLRALAARGPYFSDGSAATVTDVVKFYDKRFGIGFTATEMADLASFLLAL